MKALIKFNIGSQVFFKDNFDDYVIKDSDELWIMDNWKIQETNVLNFKNHKQDIFYFKNMSKEEFIEDTLSCSTPMRIGKFLIPEFVKYLNFTIEDLKRLEPVIKRIDEKHKYEQIIYYSYIENNDFTLNDEQLLNAYKEYKKCHT